MAFHSFRGIARYVCQAPPRRWGFPPSSFRAANTIGGKLLAPLLHFGIKRGVMLDSNCDLVEWIVFVFIAQSLFLYFNKCGEA